MKRITIAFLISLLVIVSGCVTKPTDEQLREADYGSYPSDYETIIKNYMSTRLKDPYSAQYSFAGMPNMRWVSGLGQPLLFGYGTCATINAKNSYGAYSGASTYFFLIKNGQVVSDQYVSDLNRKLCN